MVRGPCLFRYGKGWDLLVVRGQDDVGRVVLQLLHHVGHENNFQKYLKLQHGVGLNRVIDVVRPLLAALDLLRSVLRNFEKSIRVIDIDESTQKHYGKKTFFHDFLHDIGMLYRLFYHTLSTILSLPTL